MGFPEERSVDIRQEDLPDLEQNCFSRYRLKNRPLYYPWYAHGKLHFSNQLVTLNHFEVV